MSRKNEKEDVEEKVLSVCKSVGLSVLEEMAIGMLTGRFDVGKILKNVSTTNKPSDFIPLMF